MANMDKIRANFEIINCLLYELLLFNSTHKIELNSRYKQAYPNLYDEVAFFNYSAAYYLKNYSSPEKWEFPEKIFAGFTFDTAVGQNLPGLKPRILKNHILSDATFSIMATLIHEPYHDKYFGHTERMSNGKYIDVEAALIDVLAVLNSHAGRVKLKQESCCRESPNEGKKIKTELDRIFCKCRKKM